MAFMNAFCDPISPEDLIFEQGYGERMGHLDARNNLSVCSIEVGVLNRIKSRIDPKQFETLVINGQTIWPAYFSRHQASQSRPIHANTTNTALPPVGEIQVP